jgi:hypothetical protein
MAAIVCIGITVVVAGAPLVSVDELAKFGRALSRAKQVQMFRCGDQAAAGGRQTGDETRRGTSSQPNLSPPPLSFATIHYTSHRITCHTLNMAAVTPFMSFLRPMGLPRPATVRQFMHFSTSTSCLLQEGTRIDINYFNSPY